MGRKSSRENAFILIFQKEFHSDFDEVIQSNFYLNELENLQEADRVFIINEVVGTLQNLAEIDEFIKTTSLGWSFDRISKIDIAILRLAIYEIIFADDIPVSVSINEAVELAKKYGGEGDEDSHKFVNGILATVTKKVASKVV
jgi:transcription antitermination protein NusB